MDEFGLGQVREKYRVPLETGIRIAEKVQADLQPLSDALILVGSIRRRRPAIADIEFVVLPHDLKAFDEAVRAMGFEPGAKQRKYVGILDGVKVELYVAHKPDELGALTLAYTGDYLMNVAMRAKAKRMGYKMDQYGIWKGKKAALQSPDEREFFDFLGMEWHWPEERSLAARGELDRAARALLHRDLPAEERAFVLRARETLKTRKFLDPQDEAALRAMALKIPGTPHLDKYSPQIGLMAADGFFSGSPSEEEPYEDARGLWQALYERETGHDGVVRSLGLRHFGGQNVQIWLMADEDGRPAYYLVYTGEVPEESLQVEPEEFLGSFAEWAIETDEPPVWLGPFGVPPTEEA